MNKQDTRRLLQKYRDGRCTPEERSWVEQWYVDRAREEQAPKANISGRHLAAWKQIQRNIAAEKRQGKSWISQPVVAAASVILLLGLSFLIYRNRLINSQSVAGGLHYRSVATGNGELRKFELPDGSQVWLNAASKLRYSDGFGKALREVFLDEGEAYFDVQHDAGKPFIVYAGKTKTRVLGTAFAVRAYRSLPQTQVTVTRGKVGVMQSGKGRSDAILLVQNQQVTFSDSSNAFEKTEIIAVDYTGWTVGKLKFNNESFNTIALILEKRFGATVRFQEKSIGELRFSAGFEASETLDDILHVLCLAENLAYTRTGNAVALSRK